MWTTGQPNNINKTGETPLETKVTEDYTRTPLPDLNAATDSSKMPELSQGVTSDAGVCADIYMHLQNSECSSTVRTVANNAEMPKKRALRNIGLSLDCEMADDLQFYRNDKDGNSVPVAARDMVQRKCQSLSEAALENAAKINLHNPGFFTNDADRASFHFRRDIRQTLHINEEIARLFRNRLRDRSVRFYNGFDESTRIMIQNNREQPNPSLLTLRSALTNSSTTTDSSLGSSLNIRIEPSRTIEFSGGQTNLYTPLFVDEIRAGEIDESDSSFADLYNQQHLQNNTFNLVAVALPGSNEPSASRVLSVQNAGASRVRRIYVNTSESTAEISQNYDHNSGTP